MPTKKHPGFLYKGKSGCCTLQNGETRLCRPATLSYEPAWQVGDCKNAFEVPMSYRQGVSATF